MVTDASLGGPAATPSPSSLRPALVAEFSARALGDIDLDTLVDAASAAAAAGMGVERAKVLQYRPDQEDLLVRSGVNWQPGVVGHASLASDLASPPGRAWRTSEPAAIADLTAQTEYRHSPLLRAHGVVSLLNVPIPIGGENWGVLEADSEQPGVFHTEHVHFLQGLANVLGAAILRLRSAQALREHTERLQILSDAAATLLAARDPAAALTNLFFRLRQPFGVDAMVNFTADEAARVLHLTSSQGVPEPMRHEIAKLGFADAICGSVAETRAPIRVARLRDSEDPRVRLLQALGIRAYACEPLLSDGELLGTLSFASRTREEFSPDAIAFFRTISHYFAVVQQRVNAEHAIQQANEALEQRVQERTQELAASNARLRQEVAERTRAEAELRQREADYRTLYNNAPAPQHSLDGDGNIIGVSDYWLELMGYARAEVIGKPIAAFLTPESVEVRLAEWPRCTAADEPPQIELGFVKRSGEIMEALVSRRMEFDAAGGFVRSLGVVTDLTALRKAERERDRLFEISQELILIAGFDGNIHDANPAMEQALGYQLAEIRGVPYLNFVHPDDRAAAAEAVQALRSGEAPRQFELRYRHRDGSWRWTSWRSTPVVAEQLIYAIGRDITQRREQEAALRQTQKMEAVGHLTGGIAHDFNNLLTVINGNAELLRGRLADQPRLLRMIQGVQQAVSRGENLTRQLLAFARHQDLHPEVLDVNQLIRRFEPLLRRAAGETVRVETTLAAELWPSLIDAGQLEAALLNLAVNARDAMPDGGRLQIETANVARDWHLPARVAGASPGPYVTITVADTGSGIPADLLDRIFEPFFTTKEVGKGSGLGLSQIYGFVQQSGGHITVDSEPGAGTAFRLYLPPAEAALVRRRQTERLQAERLQAERLQTERRQAEPARGREPVLVVEDNPEVLRTAIAMLGELGYQVRAVASPADALELLRGDTPIALLFSDVVMPQMSGPELARAALALRPGLKILLTTGYDRSRRPNAPAPETFPLIAKPYKQAVLAARLRAILDG